MTIEIPLTKGYTAIIDDEDTEQAQYKWVALVVGDGEYVYATRISNGKRLLLHREITKAGDDLDVDHINHNGLDNRRANLRVCSHSQNLGNRKISRANKTGYKGVRKVGNRYKAYINSGKYVYLGYFPSPEDAAHAYDQAAKQRYGEFACLNFPEG